MQPKLSLCESEGVSRVNKSKLIDIMNKSWLHGKCTKIKSNARLFFKIKSIHYFFLIQMPCD